jgi:hypothetical protein
MPRAKRRIDYASFPGGPIFELTRKQQVEVERLYGTPISADIWEKIFEHTSTYTMIECAIQRAPTVETIEKPLESFKRAALRLRNTIDPGSRVGLSEHDPLNVKVFADGLPGASNANMFDCYLYLLEWIIRYTSRVQELQKKGYVRGFKGSGRWYDWVADIRSVLKRAELPAGISNEKELPFVRLVMALQNRMPPECRQYMHSPRSLSAAIARSDARSIRGAH